MRAEWRGVANVGAAPAGQDASVTPGGVGAVIPGPAAGTVDSMSGRGAGAWRITMTNAAAMASAAAIDAPLITHGNTSRGASGA